MQSYFHTPERYFLSHSVGCLLKTTPDFVARHYFSPWQMKGGQAWPDWLDVINAFRSELAAFLGASKADICPQTNVTSALTKIFYSLPERAGRKTILLSEQDFPTIGFALKQAERAGYQLRFIQGDPSDPQSWYDALDETMQMVHITHALSNTSHLLPVRDICKRARQHGVYSVVDIAQSVGILPIKLADWDADFATGTSVKFLCGGPGACFLYVNPNIVGQCLPIDVGWFSHDNPFELDIRQFRFAPDALRFFGGTPSPAPFATALNAIQFWQNHQGAAPHTQAALSRLSAAVPDMFLISPRRAEERGGTLVIAPKDRDAIKTALGQASIMFDERKEGLRFSVHAYTSEHDIQSLEDVFRIYFS